MVDLNFKEIVNLINEPLCVIDINYQIIFRNLQYDEIFSRHSIIDFIEDEIDLSNLNNFEINFNDDDYYLKFIKIKDAFIITIKDTTEQKKIKNINNNLKIILDNIESIIYVLDVNSMEIIYMNAFAKVYLGNFIGMKCSLLKEKNYSNCQNCFLDDMYQDGKIKKTNHYYIYRDERSLRWYSCHDKIIEWDNEKIAKIHIAVDITDQKEIEEILEIQVQEEMQKQSAQQSIMLHQSRLAAMGEMISNIAHQWRQPITAIGGVFEELKDSYNYNELTKETLYELVRDGQNIINYMSKTIDDFRNFFKPNKQKIEFNMSKAIKNSIALIFSTLKSYNIKLNEDLDETLTYFSYENEFSQVILNIISNSKDVLIEKHIKNPIIDIKLYKQDNSYIITIKDNGGGIDNKIINKIFEPYFTTKEEGKGTGIGLYMSKMIIEKNMNGKISVFNEEECAVFCIELYNI